MVTPLKTFMGFSVHLNVQLKFYNLPFKKIYYDLLLVGHQSTKFLQSFTKNVQTIAKMKNDAIILIKFNKFTRVCLQTI